MVTIEQKLLLFSKLINQLMNGKLKEESAKSEKEFEERFENEKRDIDLEISRIRTERQRKENTEKMKKHSDEKMLERRMIEDTKKECLENLMKKLNDKVKEYTSSNEYKEFFLKTLNELKVEKTQEETISIYVTEKDSNLFKNEIEKFFSQFEYKDTDYSINKNADIIGGFIIEYDNSKIRMDLSMKTILDDNKPYIMQMMWECIEGTKDESSTEVGETNAK